MFVARRTWDQDSIQAFNAKRDEKRARDGLESFSLLSAEERKAEAQSEKASLTDDQWSKLILQAPPLERYPLQQAIAPYDGVLVCPQIFRLLGTTRGKVVPTTKILFNKSQNLFIKAHCHYCERVGEGEEETGKNYVSKDPISPRRYEYLGPEPRIAGFYLEGKEAQVLFYDSNLTLPWTMHGKWRLRMEYDETVEALVPAIEIEGYGS